MSDADEQYGEGGYGEGVYGGQTAPPVLISGTQADSGHSADPEVLATPNSW